MSAHWHLVEPVVWSTFDPARFDQERWLAERSNPTGGVSRTADEVVAFLDGTLDLLIETYELDETALVSSGIATTTDRLVLTEVRRRMAGQGRDICALLAIGNGRIAHYAAYAFRSGACAHH
jgi:hypothetical protein